MRLAHVIGLFVLAACADPLPVTTSGRAVTDAGAKKKVEGASSDFAIPPIGVANQGRAASLVVVEAGATARCSGVVVASKLVLVPAPCVARSSRCVPLPAAALFVRSGDAAREIVADVYEIVTDDPCDEAAVAGLVLVADAAGVPPVPVRARPASAGEFFRAAFVRMEPPQPRLIRDHLRVDFTTRTSARLAADPCDVLVGASLFDEATAELVAMNAVAAPHCEETVMTFAQVDASRAVVERAFQRAAAPRPAPDGGAPVDAGVSRRGKAQRPTTDLGDSCEVGAECAAGVCVLEDPAAYCSRSCGPGDRCPTEFHCEREAATSVCRRR